jgi:hypothetical protein
MTASRGEAKNNDNFLVIHKRTRQQHSQDERRREANNNTEEGWEDKKTGLEKTRTKGQDKNTLSGN